MIDEITLLHSMFIKYTSVLLVIVMLSSSFTRVVFYAGYALNKEYISKVLCENKAKPKMGCLGKCYLKKKIKEAQEKEQQQGSSDLKKHVEGFVNKKYNFRFYTFQTAKYSTSLISLYNFSSEIIFFHPPPHSFRIS